MHNLSVNKGRLLQVGLSVAAPAFPLNTPANSIRVCLPTNRPQKDREDSSQVQMQSPYRLLAAMTPQQIYPPAPGSTQLQFAIKRLQQQTLRSQQFLDQSHRRQQVQRPLFILLLSAEPTIIFQWLDAWMVTFRKITPWEKIEQIVLQF